MAVDLLWQFGCEAQPVEAISPKAYVALCTPSLTHHSCVPFPGERGWDAPEVNVWPEHSPGALRLRAQVQ